MKPLSFLLLAFLPQHFVPPSHWLAACSTVDGRWKRTTAWPRNSPPPHPLPLNDAPPAASSVTEGSCAIRPDSVLGPAEAYLIWPTRPSFGQQRL